MKLVVGTNENKQQPTHLCCKHICCYKATLLQSQTFDSGCHRLVRVDGHGQVHVDEDTNANESARERAERALRGQRTNQNLPHPGALREAVGDSGGN